MKKIILLVSTFFLLIGCEDSDIKNAKNELSVKMKDPTSVQWKDVKKINENLICGEYNAKNSYGAYTGFKRFAKLRELLIIDDEKAIIIAGCDGEEASKKEIDEISQKMNRELERKQSIEKKEKIIMEARELVMQRLLSPGDSTFSFENVYTDNVVCGYFYIRGASIHGNYIVDNEKNVYLYHMNSKYKGISTGYKGETPKNFPELESKYCKK